MSRFVQLHFLTSYPVSNPNRDDMGRPKSAEMGGVRRLRISSQSLKRAVRTSVAFREAFDGQMGARTARLGEEIKEQLIKEGLPEADLQKALETIMAVFGKLEKGSIKTNQLALISPHERELATDLVRRVVHGEKMPADKDLKPMILQNADGAVDIAMFGRMLAGAPAFNRDAAVQVSHAITTHKAVAENDFYSAVDDLQERSDEEGAGAGFIGDAGFGSGVYYTYACINTALLVENLSGDCALAQRAVDAFIQTILQVSPSGKQNSFANRPFAEYGRVEIGNQQPRDLSSAFLNPVIRTDRMVESIMVKSIKELEAQAARYERAFGPAADEVAVMNVPADTGTVADLVALGGSAVARANEEAA